MLDPAHARHRRCPTDTIMSHALSDPGMHPQHLERLADTGLADDERLRAVLVEWFTWATAALASHPDSPDDVPLDLGVPRWSWDGPA